MYCPNCGVNNQAEVKFCTRCGTNLGIVSEALTGKIKTKSDPEERSAKVMRDYYRGRRDAITGAVMIPAALLIMTIMAAAGMNPIGAFFVVCWMFFWGAGSLAGGLGKWIAASSEMKSAGYGLRSQFQDTHPQNLPPAMQADLAVPDYSTGPVGYPGSITEQTTRQLEERRFAPVERDQDRDR
jgi:hypothetical protein